MNIYLFTDLRFTASPTPTGVGKHIIHMAGGLNAINGNHLEVLAARDQAGTDGRLPPGNALSYLPSRRMPLSRKAAEAIWTLAKHPIADRWCDGADWVYCPKNDIIPLKKIKYAVTIHGAHELDPNMPQKAGLNAALNRWRKRTQYNYMCRRADAILVVSEFLKSQVIEWFHADPDKITVVGNGIDPCFYEEGKKPDVGMSSDTPYVICVGGLNFLDGGDRALTVAGLLRKANSTIKVLVAGWQHDKEKVAVAKTLGNVDLLGYVPSDRLAPLMKNSIALLYLTRYETFGMAAAEAMAAGTPVVTCRSTAVPEIVGDAGIYVDPEKPQEAADAILELSSCGLKRAEYIARGKKIAAMHTWEACVTRLHRALSGGR